MRQWIAFITYMFALPAFGELERWQNWELSRNDLQVNRFLFFNLPSRLELKSYQSETIYVVEVDSDQVQVIYAKEADKEFVRQFQPVEGKMKFYIHPKALELFHDLIGEQKLEIVKVDPTTSPRTFFIDDHLIKLSLPQKINGAIRTIYPLQMQRATIVNDMLSKITGFDYLPEPMAIYWGNPGTPFGFIVRQIPPKIVNGKTTLVPVLSYVAHHRGGSLFENDAKSRGWKLEELAERLIIPSLVRSFVLAASHGIALEAHQQNLLLQVDEYNRFTGRVFYRDLDGVRVDFGARKNWEFQDEEILRIPVIDWIFHLGKLNTLNPEPIQGRPEKWSPLMEEAFKQYLLGSTIDLFAQNLHKLTLSKGRVLISLKNIAERELMKVDLAPLCSQVF